MRLRRKAEDEEVTEDVDAEAEAAAEAPSEPSSLLLLRCPTPTNFLCPCGAVERRLRKLDLDHRVDRVPYKRRGSRPEVVELTGQSRVPVLVDGDEVIHDSKRILQYLDWRYGEDEDEDVGEVGEDAEDGSDEEKRPAITSS